MLNKFKENGSTLTINPLRPPPSPRLLMVTKVAKYEWSYFRPLSDPLSA